ncbi:hypothetical protein LUZ61_022917 [Rhynchospora tenuis]|uniref:Uncharacterized protein ycf72 n=1 Tax=Rhynchospora tenuis TaxID=198213 RepID=A0AAD5W420_9POAL|nr:hypothetical protein LUZ61_022946 [Rhynchospora tenuis]KAJ3668364.1 hypothetical protein LUZ61_022917 [Rhynchospora tenuis]
MRGFNSRRFIATPLTTGRLPSQHFDPALPKLFRVTPTLPTCPTVAKQFWDIKRTSPDGNLNVADLPSFAISFATAYRLKGTSGSVRASNNFLHITISLESIILYEKLLNSITCCRRAFPIDIGTSVPETMVSPIIAPLGCKIYLFSPSP